MTIDLDQLEQRKPASIIISQTAEVGDGYPHHYVLEGKVFHALVTAVKAALAYAEMPVSFDLDAWERESKELEAALEPFRKQRADQA